MWFPFLLSIFVCDLYDSAKSVMTQSVSLCALRLLSEFLDL